MSSSSYTTRSEGPYRNHPLVTAGLLMICALLIAFGILSATTPPWLVTLSDPGRQVECTDAKNLGDDALRRGQLALAIAQYQHALNIRPDEGGAIVNLGVALLRAGQIEQGEAVLRRGLEVIDSDISRGLILAALGVLDEQRGDLESAIGNFVLAVACGTDLVKRYHRLGSLYLSGGELAKARQVFTTALEHQLDPASSYREMLHLGLDAMEDDSVHVDLIRDLLARPMTAEELARYDLETIRLVQMHDHAVAETHNYLGWVAIQSEDFPEATQQFERSQEIWPGNRNAVENLKVLRQMEEDLRRSGDGS